MFVSPRVDAALGAAFSAVSLDITDDSVMLGSTRWAARDQIFG
ncbi:hypothetical protein ACU4GD_45375 [Cupriavidus basilensis]